MRTRLTLHKETIKELQESALSEVFGGSDWITTVQPDPNFGIVTKVQDLCDPNWVSTSPPTQMCQ